MNICLNSSWGVILFNSLLAFHFAILIGSVLVIWKRSRLRSTDALLSTEIENDTQNQERIPWIPLVVLSIVALTLRVWQLNSDLWYDEVASLVQFMRPPLAEIITSFPSQNQHMFYSILGHISINLFGESAWAVRLPAVFLGLASLWAVFFLGRQLFGSREALFAFALTAFSYHHIWFSQNARGYTGLMFFATISTWFYLKAVNREGWKDWLLYTATVVLGMWTHLIMGFVVAGQGLVFLFLLSNRKQTLLDWRKPLLAFLLAVTLTLQLYALALPEFIQVALHKGGLESEWTNPLWMIAEGIRGLNLGVLSIPVLLFGGGIFLSGWIGMLSRDRKAAVLMALPGVLGGLTMIAMGHNLWPRFFFFSMGFVILIVVHGTLTLPRILFHKFKNLHLKKDILNRAGLALTYATILLSLFSVPRCYALPKQDFSGARDFIEQNRLPAQEVVAVGLAGFAYKSYYAPQWHRGETEKILNELLESNRDLWLIYTLPVELKAYHPEIWLIVQNHFKIVRSFPGTLGGGQVVVCRSRGSSETSQL